VEIRDESLLLITFIDRPRESAFGGWFKRTPTKGTRNPLYVDV
jgi:hypothetical protein